MTTVNFTGGEVAIPDPTPEVDLTQYTLEDVSKYIQVRHREGRGQVSAPDLAELLPSWELALRSERKAPATIKVYGNGFRTFL